MIEDIRVVERAGLGFNGGLPPLSTEKPCVVYLLSSRTDALSFASTEDRNDMEKFLS